MTALSSGHEGSPVAIVGIGCRFPGGVTDPKSFWRLLSDGVDAITEIPADRIDLEHYFDPRPAIPGRMMTRWGGFLDHIDEFDALFFGISPREAERLDPQQRLLLETAWEALEDAGQDTSLLDGSPTSVFIGQWLSDFESRLFADPEGVDFQMTTGSGRYAASGRISYALGLRGPSLTLDSACSSSLAAIHLAVRSIRSGESSMALAGGVNIILQPHISVAYSQSKMMAPDGHCKFGDASGDGYVRSEGAGIVVLKPLERARADGDRIYAVIRGSAVNNDGRSSGSMGTPSQIGQEELLRTAYRDAQLAPGRVGYIEAHGTGTRAGDPVELGALANILGQGRMPGNRAWVGSVKTNIGHTEGAAGVAGLIKVALTLHHGMIPRSLHCNELNPSIRWDDVPVAIPRALTRWSDEAGTRIAGVSAFGIAGTNAHIVLEQAPSPAPAADVATDDRHEISLLPLSAKSPEALQAMASRYAELLVADGAPFLQDVCWSAATRRTALEHRAVFVAADSKGMLDSLRGFSRGEAAAADGIVRSDKRSRIAFVVPGQGAQWTGMARELALHEPVFRATLQQCDDAARPITGWSIVEQLGASSESPNYLLDRIDVIQPVLVAVAIAYSALWRSKGIVPDAVVGHSMGEVGAACIAGVLDLDQAMRIICRRSALMRRTSGNGAMAMVELTMDEARARIKGREEKLSVAVSNSPRSSVISGEPDAVQQVMAVLERDQVFCRLVKVDVASHSPQMEPLAIELAAELAGLTPHEAIVPIYSTVLGRRAEAQEFDAGYWARNMRQPVLFTNTISRLIQEGVTVFIELGPHPVLLPSVQQTAQSLGVTATTIACGRRDESEHAVFMTALGALWAAGGAVDWRMALPTHGQNIRLPLYPWQRERYWAEAAEIGAVTSGAQQSKLRPDDESLAWLYRMCWRLSEPQPAANLSRMASPRWLVVSADESATILEKEMLNIGVLATAVPLQGFEGNLEQELPNEGPLTGVIVVAPENADAAYLPIYTLQAILRSTGCLRPRLWFVTRGSQSVGTGLTARVSVDAAALWGAARVIGEEHPDFWGGLVDLDPRETLANSAPLLVRHLLAADGEDQVALRGNQRFVLRLVTNKSEKVSSAFAWRADAAYLITGGLGGIGIHIARAMAARGARRLVLLGRTALPERNQWGSIPMQSTTGQRVAAVRELEAAGVAVHLATLDVGDEIQLRTFLERYTAEAWPPICGVIHAAGAFNNHLAGTMDRDAFDAVVRAKLVGAQLLDRMLPDLDLFVLFSSTGAFLTQPGQANYAAANAGLDALAQDRNARGLPALSVAWGVWENTGLVKGHAGERNVGEMARQGIQSFAPERGTALFGWLCGQTEPNAIVLPIDWTLFRKARAGRDFPLFRELFANSGAETGGPAGLSDRLAKADLSERRKLLETVVRDTVGRVLKIAPSRLDPRKALGALGLNSLMAMELRNRLEAALGRSLSATLAWNYPTVEALVEHLAGAGPALLDAPSTATPTALPEDLSTRLHEVAGLSDEEVAMALRTRRPRS